MLLTDEEFLVWCGEHKVKGCGKTRPMVVEGEEIRDVSICEDCRAKAQLKKVVEWVIENNDFDEPEDNSPGAYYVISKKLWQSLLEEVDEKDRIDMAKGI